MNSNSNRESVSWRAQRYNPESTVSNHTRNTAPKIPQDICVPASSIVSSPTPRNLNPRFCSSSSSHNQMQLKVRGRIRVYLVLPYSAMCCVLRLKYLSTPYLRWDPHS